MMKTASYEQDVVKKVESCEKKIGVLLSYVITGSAVTYLRWCVDQFTRLSTSTRIQRATWIMTPTGECPYYQLRCCFLPILNSDIT